jgi:Flp pilus assembly protein TadD
MLRIPTHFRPLLFLLTAACIHKKLADGVRGDPNDDEAWGDAGDAEAAQGNTAQALTDYLRAMTIDPRDTEWQRKVAEFGGVDTFRVTIDRLLPDSYTDDEALGDRGDAYAAAGLIEESCDLYRRALELDTQDTEWMGKVGGCEPVVEEVQPYDVYDSYSGILGSIGYQEGGVVGGVLGGSIGGYGDYGSYYTDSLSYAVVGDPAAVTAALDHARAGQKPEARNALWVALQSNPNASDLRAMWTMLTGESALVLLQKLADANPEDPALWGALGDARLAAGKRAEAITAWQKAAALAPYDTAWSNRMEMAKVVPK